MKGRAPKSKGDDEREVSKALRKWSMWIHIYIIYTLYTYDMYVCYIYTYIYIISMYTIYMFKRDISMKFPNLVLLEFVYYYNRYLLCLPCSLCVFNGRVNVFRCVVLLYYVSGQDECISTTAHPFFWRPFGSKRLNNCFKMFPQVIGSTMVLGLEFGKAECLDLCVESKYQTFVFEAITCSTPERQWPHYLTPALKWRLGWRFTTLERQMKQCHAVPLAVPNRCPANRASDPSKWLWRWYWDGGMWLYVIHGFAWHLGFQICSMLQWFDFFDFFISAVQPSSRQQNTSMLLCAVEERGPRDWLVLATNTTCILDLIVKAYSKILLDAFF